jgi:hypothetical protein
VPEKSNKPGPLSIGSAGALVVGILFATATASAAGSAPTTALPASGAPSPPEPAFDGQAAALRDVISVELRQRKPLRLVEHVVGRQRLGVGLDGVLEVAVRNRGPRPVTVTDLHVLGLLFVEAKSRASFLVMHPCDAIFACGYEQPHPGWVRTHGHPIAPDSSVVFTVEEFGCGGGSWKPPPPGEYDVVYRVKPEWKQAEWKQAPARSAAADGGARSGPPPPYDLPACRARLESSGYWTDGASSEPIRVRLRKPVRKRIRL